MWIYKNIERKKKRCLKQIRASGTAVVTRGVGNNQGARNSPARSYALVTAIITSRTAVMKSNTHSK